DQESTIGRHQRHPCTIRRNRNVPYDGWRCDREWLALERLHVQTKRLARLVGKCEQVFAIGKIAGPLILEPGRREIDWLSVAERHEAEPRTIPRAERQCVLTVRREAHPQPVA